MGKLIPTAHEQDFERKKKSRLSDRDSPDNMERDVAMGITWLSNGWGDNDDGDKQNVIDMERSWYMHS